MTATLFDPIQLGAISAPNRILMAPLTRGRSEGEHVPLTDLKAEYYSSAVPPASLSLKPPASAKKDSAGRQRRVFGRTRRSRLGSQ